MRLPLLCLLFVGLLGCAFQQHMSRGDDLYNAGDYPGALAEYQAAAALDPSSPQITDRLADTRRQISLVNVERARSSLRSGDLPAALARSLEALRTLPQDNSVQQLAVDVAAAYTARASEHESRGEFAPALGLLRSVYDAYPLQRPRLEAAIGRITETWTQKLSLNAAEAEKGGNLGDALLLYAQAAQLKRSPEIVARRDELRAKLIDQHTYRLVLKGGARSKPRSYVVGLLGSSKLAYAVLPKGRAPATVSLSVGSPGCRTRTSSSQRSKRYQSGTKRVPNPFYASKRSDVERAEREVLRRQEDVNRYQKDYDDSSRRVREEGDTPGTSTGAEQSLRRATSSLERARTDLIRDQKTLQRKREELARESPEKEEPVFSDLSYSVQTHTRECVASLKVRIEHADKRDPLEANTNVGASDSDTTHRDHPVAGVRADPLQLQSADTLRDGALRAAAGLTRRLITKSLESHRQKMLKDAESATSESARIHGYVLYILLNPGSVSPDVISEIAQARGIPDPVTVLTWAR